MNSTTQKSLFYFAKSLEISCYKCSNFRMRYILNNYDVNAIKIDEIESKIEAVIDSFVHWIGSLDRKRSRRDDGTLYVGDMGIVFLILTVPKLFNNQKCLVRVSKIIQFLMNPSTVEVQPQKIIKF